MKPPFPEGTIYRFSPNTSYFFLSNFYPSSITYEGLTFISSEHAYQAAKTTDIDIRKLIQTCSSAGQAKKQGGNIKLREGWNQMKQDIMYELLSQKFAHGSKLAEKLRETGKVLLVEANGWHDIFWGQCSCNRHNYEGMNALGLILMRIRNNLEALWKSEQH